MKKVYLVLFLTGILLKPEILRADNLLANEIETGKQVSQNHSESRGATSNLDVIIVFDNSDSMAFHVSTLEFYLNFYFYQELHPAEFNTRVILISDDSNDNEGICIEGPLGSGACPSDENLPNYQHVVQNISGDNALSTIISTYDQWDQTLRANSKRAVMVISDGNADMTANEFISALISLDNDFSGFQFHAIARTQVDGCQNHIDFRTVYTQLADITNGLHYSIFNEFYDGIWRLIANNITDSIFQSEFECIGH